MTTKKSKKPEKPKWDDFVEDLLGQIDDESLRRKQSKRDYISTLEGVLHSILARIDAAELEAQDEENA